MKVRNDKQREIAMLQLENLVKEIETYDKIIALKQEVKGSMEPYLFHSEAVWNFLVDSKSRSQS